MTSPRSNMDSPRHGTRVALPLVALLTALAAVMAAGVASPARGATITWTGLGATTNWNLAANWSTLTAPGAGDVAVFDGTGSKPALVNANINVGGVQVTAAYTGSITQGAGRSITVGAAGWVQGGATFTGSAAAVTINGPLTLTGGTYLSTSGTLSVSGDLALGGGTFSHNSGTLRFTGAAAAVDVPGSLTVWNLVLAHNNATPKTLDPADALVVDGLLTLTNGTWEGGELRAHGPIAAASGFDGGAATLRIDGSGDQLFTGSATTAAGALPNLVIDKSSGTLTLAGTVRTARDWTYLAGSLDPGTSSVVFAGAQTISGSHSLAGVEFRGASVKTLAPGTTLVVTGLLTLTDGDLDGATLAARGNIVATSTFDGETATLRIDGSGDQLLTGSATVSAGELPNLVIDKPSGTLTLAGTIRVVSGGWTYLAGTLDPGTSTVVFDSGSLLSGSHSLANVALRGTGSKGIGAGETLTVTGTLSLVDGTWDTGTLAAHGNLTQAATADGGTGVLRIDGSVDQLFTGSATTAAGALPNLVIDKSSGTLTLAGTVRTARDWTYLAGSLDPGTSSVVFAGAQTISGSHSLAGVEFRGASVKTLAPGTTLVVTGLLTLTDGDLDGATLAARGNIVATSTFDGETATLRIDGSGDQLLTGSATVSAGELPNLVIDKPSGTLTLAGTIRVVSGGWTYLAGTLDPGTSTVVFDSGSLLSGSHSLANVALRGTGSKGIGAGETLTVTGTLSLVDGTWDTGTLAAHGNLTQAATADGGTGVLRIDGSVDQLFTGSATTAAGALPNLVIDKSSGTLTLAGTVRTARDWTYLAGSLDPGTSTLILTGVETLTTGDMPLHNLVVRAGVATLEGALILTGDLTVSGGTFDLDGHDVDIAGSLTVAGTVLADVSDLSVAGNVSVTGTFTAGAGSVILDGSATQTIAMGGSSLNDLRIDNGSGVTLAADLAVGGELELAAGPLTIGAHRLTIAMPIAELGGTLVTDATSAISVAGTAPDIRILASVSDLGELEIVNPAGVALDGPITIHLRLDLAGGNVDAGPHLVAVAPGGTVIRTSGHVIGRLQKTIGAGSPVAVLFEIGDASGYTPVDIVFDAVLVGGTITASTVAGDDVAALSAVGLVPSASVNRTWTIVASGVVAASSEVQLTYVASDLDPGADPMQLRAVTSSGGSSTLTPVINRTTTSVTTSIPGAPDATFALGMAGANMAVLLTGPSSGVVGVVGAYRASVTNAGPFDASSVRVAITLPPAAAVSSIAVSQGTCTPTGSGLSCDLGPLVAGATATIDLVISFDAAGTHLLVVAASTSGSAVDPDAGNDMAQLSVVISGAPGEPSPSASPSLTPRRVPPGGVDELPNTADPARGPAGAAIAAWLAVAGLAVLGVASRRHASGRR